MSSSTLNQRKNICYRCRKSALNNNELFSCNFCTLFWHLDCIPSSSSSSSEYSSSEGKSSPAVGSGEWMCPQHQRPTIVKKYSANSKKSSIKARQEIIEEFEEADEIIKYGGVINEVTEKTLEDNFLDYAKRYRTFNRPEKRYNEEAKDDEEAKDYEEVPTKIEAEEWLDNLTSTIQYPETNHQQQDGLQMLINAANADLGSSPLPEKKKEIDLDEQEYERFQAIQKLIDLKGEDALLELLSQNS